MGRNERRAVRMCRTISADRGRLNSHATVRKAAPPGRHHHPNPHSLIADREPANHTGWGQTLTLGAAASGGPVHGSLQLRLVHLRAAADPVILRLLVELVAGPTAGASVRAQAAAPPGRDVRPRQSRGPPRLTGPGSLLVDRAGGDLLGAPLARAALAESRLDVFVLTFPLGAPGSLWHGSSFAVLSWCYPSGRGGNLRDSVGPIRPLLLPNRRHSG